MKIRDFVKPKAIGAVAATAIVLTTAACGGSDGGASQGASSTDAISIAVFPPITLDAVITQNGVLLDNIYENLVYWDPDDESQLRPVLAASMPTQIDPLTWEVKLRPGVTFSNGEPFNAEAAAFSINHYLDPANNGGNISEFSGVEGATAIGDDTIHITTTEPDPILPARLTRLYMIPPEYALTEDFATHPIGTGPYTFVDYSPGQYLDIARNDDYWGEIPEIETARFRFITDNQAMVAALRTGEVQLAYNVLASSADEVPKFIVEDGINNAYLRMKTYEGPLEDQDLRQAIAYLADTKSYTDSIYNGTAEVLSCQVMGESVTGFNPNLEPHPYDPEVAQQLVEASDYDGTPVTISAPTDWLPLVSPVIESLASSMNSVGINTNVQLTSRDVWGKDILIGINDGQPDIVFSASSTELHDADKLSVLIGADGTLSSDPSPSITEGLDAARVELDPAARQSMYEAINEQICDEARLIPLYRIDNTWGAVENLEWSPMSDSNARVADMTLTASDQSGE